MAGRIIQRRCRTRAVATHPLAPAAAIAVSTGGLGLMLAVRGPTGLTLAGIWVMFGLAAGYAVSGSP